MKLWPIFSIFLLSQQAVLLGQDPAAGSEALAAGLWEVAELQFRNALADPSLTVEAKAETSVRLAESLIRGGNPSEALELLDKSFVAKHAEARFWRAQALAGLGRFSESVSAFSESLTDPASPHRIEAGLTRARLQLSLELTDAALDSLSSLLPGLDPETAAGINLYRVEILIDSDRAEEARELLPPAETVKEIDRPRTAFLEAQLLLKEQRPAQAEAAFRKILSQPRGQSRPHYHAAAVGFADAMEAQNAPEAASLSLLDFVGEHPETPVLDAISQRIVRWLPEKPTAGNLVLAKIQQWITPAKLPETGPISTAADTGAAAAWPFIPPSNDLLTFALHSHALGMRRMGTAESKLQARSELNRLRLENPSHQLADRALYELARWALDDGDVERAFFMLGTLRSSTNSSTLRGEAAFFEARVAHLNGNPELAVRLFDEAAASLAGADAKTARLQAAIARLRIEGAATQLIQQSSEPKDRALEADFALERALSIPRAQERMLAIEEFLTGYPNHPREPEARLAAAEAALANPSPDLDLARAQLAVLATGGGNPAGVSASRIALARLRLADLSKNSAATIAAAQEIIANYPGQPEAAEAALILGQSLFQAGDYNPARLVLEKLAASDTDPARAQVAWLLAARSAALGGTPQSKEQALVLYDKTLSSEGPVTTVASLEKARHLIDLYRLDEASVFLRKFISTLPERNPLHLPAGLLLGETLYAQGGTNPKSLIEALAVYDRLLTHTKTHPSLANRLQYLRGATFEQLPDETDPNKKREKQALQAYYSVLETTEPPAEWVFFERCGFRALALLEKAERWQTAINVAEKIASFKGPRAEEAAARASQIQLKEHVF